MTSSAFYLAALALAGLAYLCLRKPATYSPYRKEHVSTRKSVGHFLLFTAIIPLALGYLTQIIPRELATAPPTRSAIEPDPTALRADANSPLSPNTPVSLLLQQTSLLIAEQKLTAALELVNAALRQDPKNATAFILRGNIHCIQNRWRLAENDYRAALLVGGKNSSVDFNLAELKFMQKRFDDARCDFLVLERDPDASDLAAYKVFLCDLLAGHSILAARELEAFNQTGANASYYFANAAWSLDHQNIADARGWLTSAAHIYPISKYQIYCASLADLGYPWRLSRQTPPPLSPIQP